MRYGINAAVYSWAFTKMLKSYYRTYFPKTDIDSLSAEINKEYKEMLKRTPGIGKSSNEANLTGACYFFSMAKVIPGMTPDIMDDIIDKSIRSDFMIKLHQGKKKKGVLFSPKTQQKKMEEAERSHHSNYEMDWEFTYEAGKDEFYLTYTKCGICRLAEREHMEDYLPCMCKMDFPKFEMLGGRLIRTKTLAAGDECCNFHVIKE